MKGWNQYVPVRDGYDPFGVNSSIKLYGRNFDVRVTICNGTDRVNQLFYEYYSALNLNVLPIT